MDADHGLHSTLPLVTTKTLRTGPLVEYRANAELQEEAMRCDVDMSYHYDGSGPMPRL